MEFENKLAEIKTILKTPKLFEPEASAFKSHSHTIDYFLKNNSSLNTLAYILNNKNTIDRSYIIELAKSINKIWHKNEIQFYAVSYISDFCVNKCVYCGHSKDIILKRKILNNKEMLLDFKQALKLGPSEICILAGENKLVNPEKLAKAVNIAKAADIYNSLDKVILNVAPMSTKRFIELRKKTSMNIQYRIFQESYDKEVYELNHQSGPKSDFNFRLHAQERALDAKINTVGIGALLGLNKNSDFEILALIAHAKYLHQTKGKLPYSLSIPRLQPVANRNVNLQNSVNDEDYVLYHALLRLALPSVKIVVTIRETKEMQNRLRPIINIHDLDTKPGVGGNYLNKVHMQNDIGDSRPIRDRILEIINQGYSISLKNFN